ncbi:unnamed protein product [Rotaria socialis]|uniref:Uncharacterized protein n=1 Tax=Rotaria socialis TaxID=392032 RepID=A0A818MUP5_9BILA|nr:unnamed protein product [Rotaria socialis]CAF4697474.1 unnamed protein product [Rotaria socialis]
MPMLSTSDETRNMFSLFWLDESKNHVEIISQPLQSFISNIRIFDDIEECQRIIRLLDEERFIFVANNQYAHDIVPSIHDLDQLFSIYIFDVNQVESQSWIKDYSKIRAMISELNFLVARIKADHQCRIQIEECLPISVLHNLSQNDRSSTSINGTFLNFQLLIDILIKLEINPANKNELVDMDMEKYKDNEIQLNIIKEFERNTLPIRLFGGTRDNHLFIVFSTKHFVFRFFIRDIQQQLKQFQSTNLLFAYGGQNSFLSTSLDRAYTLFILGDSTTHLDRKRILFEIKADSKLINTRPFANITAQSYFDLEQEVLFMAGSIFRLTSINDDGTLATIRMTLCSDSDNDLKDLYEYKRKDHDESLTTLGHILCDLGKYDQAGHSYQKMIQELSPNDPDIGSCCQGLGSIFEIQGDYVRSLKWYQKALEFWEATLPPSHEAIGHAHNNIVHGEESQDVAGCYSNLALTYSNEKNYDDALDYQQKTLTLREQLLPADHADLADSYHNIGIIYHRLGYLDLALEHCHRSIYIYRRCLPSDHPDIANSYVIVSAIYEQKEDFEQALSYLKQAAAIYEKGLPPQHTKVIDVDRRIARVQKRVENKS